MISTRGIPYVIHSSREDYEHLSDRELYVRLAQCRNERSEIAKGLRPRATMSWLTMLLIVVTHALLASPRDLDADVVIALAMLFLLHFPSAKEVNLQREIDGLSAEAKRREAEWKMPGNEFQLGQRVYCEPEKQHGVLTSIAKLRMSDMRTNRKTLSGPNATPKYDVLLDSLDAGTFAEDEYKSVPSRPAYLWGKASARVEKDKALLMFVVGVLGLVLAALKLGN